MLVCSQNMTHQKTTMFRLLLRRQGILHSCRNISVSQRLQHDQVKTISNKTNWQKQVGPDRLLPASDFRAWKAEAAVHLRLAQSGPAASQPISVPSLLRRQVRKVLQVQHFIDQLLSRQRGVKGTFRLNNCRTRQLSEREGEQGRTSSGPGHNTMRRCR